MVTEAVAVDEIKAGDTLRITLSLDDTVGWHTVTEVVPDDDKVKVSFVSGCREKVVTLRCPFYQVRR